MGATVATLEKAYRPLSVLSFGGHQLHAFGRTVLDTPVSVQARFLRNLPSNDRANMINYMGESIPSPPISEDFHRFSAAIKQMGVPAFANATAGLWPSSNTETIVPMLLTPSFRNFTRSLLRNANFSGDLRNSFFHYAFWNNQEALADIVSPMSSSSLARLYDLNCTKTPAVLPLSRLPEIFTLRMRAGIEGIISVVADINKMIDNNESAFAAKTVANMASDARIALFNSHITGMLCNVVLHETYCDLGRPDILLRSMRENGNDRIAYQIVHEANNGK